MSLIDCFVWEILGFFGWYESKRIQLWVTTPVILISYFQAKHCFGALQKTLVELEEEISKKANSLYIDEVKCGSLRKSISINCY